MTEPLLLWLDLETSDLDETLGVILEVAWEVTGPRGEGKYLFGSVPIRYESQPDARELIHTNIVEKMHTVNGLIDDCNGPAAVPLDIAESVILNQLDTVDGEILLAGAGVAQFDLRWIRADMPSLAGRLHDYKTIDVSPIRRALELIHTPEALRGAGFPTNEGLAERFQHRAQPDMRLALSQYRWMREHLVIR